MIALLAALLAVAAVRSAPAPGTDIVVNPGQLQAALDSAQPGDRILLAPGTYSENITIRNGGQAGAPITITRATADTPVLAGRWQIRAPYVTASRLIFDGSGHGDYPIWVTRGGAGAYGSHFTLEYSEIRDAGLSGIFIGDSAPPMPVEGVVIRNCLFHDNGTNGRDDQGIYVRSGSNHLIQDNLIVRSSGNGILDSPHAQGVVIRGNEIRSSVGGIVISHALGDELPMANHTLVDGNFLKNNSGMGISLVYDGNLPVAPPGISNTVTNNWASGNGGGQYGGDGTLGNSPYTRGATWSRNSYGDPAGSSLVAPSSVGPDGGTEAPPPGGEPPPANGQVVGPGELQAALDSAKPGERILLQPGAYPENITITRGGTASAPITISRATADTPVLTGRWQIRAPYVTASRLIFDGSGHGDYPIWVTRGGAGAYGSHFTLEYSEVRNARLSGIFIGDTSPPVPLVGVVVRRCYFHDNGSSGSYDHGIYVKSGRNHVIEGNLIVRSSGFGIQNYPHAQGVVIRGNEIRGNGAGILIEHDLVDLLPMVNDTIVDGNYLKDNGGMGISIMYEGDVRTVPAGITNTVTNNWASGNGGGQYGRDGTLGDSNYTRGATWSGNVYGDPAGGVLVRSAAVGPDAL